MNCMCAKTQLNNTKVEAVNELLPVFQFSVQGTGISIFSYKSFVFGL